MTKIEQTLKQTMLRCGLVQDGDRILVGLSGGKDSMTLLELMARRSRIFNPKFTVEAAYVKMRNIPYRGGEAFLKGFAERLGVTLHVVETEFDPSTDHRHTPCYLCSHYRRRALFQKAEELGCNKLALGHHLDDVVQTALLNLIQQGSFSSFPPLLQMKHYKLDIIRPMFFIRENAISEWACQNGYSHEQQPCPYDTATQRKDVKTLAREMERLNPNFVYSVLHALGWKL